MRRIGIVGTLLAAGVLAACGDGGARAEPVGPSLSVAPTVSLSGPGVVQSNSPCEWYAQIYGGEAPYTWTWSQSHGTGYVNARTTTLESYVTSTSGTMTLSVSITDAWGRTATASKTITTSWTAPYCEI